MAGEPIRSVLIVGGGTAGWMTAAALTRALAGRCEIRLLESGQAAADTGLLLGAEAALPALRAFHGLLGLDEDALMTRTGAAFRLGRELVGWSGDGSAYIHPLGEFGATLDGIAFHDLWLRLQDLSPDSLEEYSLAATAARLGRFVRPDADPRSGASTMSYGLHLDAAHYGRFLRAQAEGGGVVRVEGEVAGIERSGDHVEAVTTETGARLAADLFVDCSGAATRLGGDAGDWEDWSAWLPADRVAWTWAARPDEPPPLTRVEAGAPGYRLTLPLQGRAAVALVYASRFGADDAAAASLGEAARVVRFRSGRRVSPWTGNCVRIGLAAAALEPLATAGLHVVQSGVTKLLGLFPDRSFGGGEAEEYNRLIGEELDRIRDFLILHYRLNGRHGEPLWDHARAVTPPETLAYKMRLFESRGRVVLYDEESFLESDWIAVFLGQGLRPRRHHPRADQLPPERLREQLARMKGLMRRAAESMPRHGDYIARYCAAESVGR